TKTADWALRCEGGNVFIRKKVTKSGTTKHCLVECRREGGKVRQKVLYYLGDFPSLEAALATARTNSGSTVGGGSLRRGQGVVTCGSTRGTSRSGKTCATNSGSFSKVVPNTASRTVGQYWCPTMQTADWALHPGGRCP